MIHDIVFSELCLAKFFRYFRTVFFLIFMTNNTIFLDLDLAKFSDTLSKSFFFVYACDTHSGDLSDPI